MSEQANNRFGLKQQVIIMQRFNEWMSFKQTVEEGNSDYQFIGTYDTETIPDLKENSEPVDLDYAFSMIPEAWKHQFPNIGNVVAGKSMNEENREVIWISIPEQSTTYIFEKTTK